MKNFYLTLGVVLMLYICTSWILSSAKPANKKSAVALSNTSIPVDVNAIFENSCMGCHATDGKRIAMVKLNFSRWDHYKPGKQAKKSAAICEMISKGEKPPKSFRESHPDAIPTASQIDRICNWSETITQTN